MVSRSEYVPSRGDLVWLSFDPQAGHEQGGRRPALVLSAESYHRKSGLALVCPITSRKKGYPFEVEIAAGLPIKGVILADQLKNVDWRARRAEFIANLPPKNLSDAVQRVLALISG